MKHVLIGLTVISLALVCGGCGRIGSQLVKLFKGRSSQAVRGVVVPASKVIWDHSSRNPRRCDMCEGNRRVWNQYSNWWMTCPKCGGSGRQ